MNTPHQARPALEAEPRQVADDLERGAVLIDVRSARERLAGYPPAAVAADGDPATLVRGMRLDPDHGLYLICESGVRSLEQARALQARGYTRARSVRGGFNAWRNAGLAAEYPAGLSSADAERYARHLVLPEIGPAGQRRLLDSAILLIGAGGLGSPAAQYLAAAGVGRIGIVDADRVERSNLQRQVLHEDQGIGEPKTASAARRLAALNPGIRVEAINLRLERENVEQVFAGWDVVIDGSDNFPTRYLVNDACVNLGMPLIYGAVMRFEGQASVFWPAGGQGVNPCYRCLFPQPPSAEDAPDCATAGVLGVLPGIIGTLQATEALKMVLGIGRPLVGRLLRIEALSMRFTESRLRADPGCPLCAPGAVFPGYADYEEFCASR